MHESYLSRQTATHGFLNTVSSKAILAKSLISRRCDLASSSFQLHVHYYNVDSLKSAMMGVFIGQKLANAQSQD